MLNLVRKLAVWTGVAEMMKSADSATTTFVFDPNTDADRLDSLDDSRPDNLNLPKVYISIANRAVLTGHFSLTYSRSPSTLLGNSDWLASFGFGDIFRLTPSDFGAASEFRVSLLFNADGSGSVVSGSIYYLSDEFEIDIGGPGNSFSGSFVPDDNSYAEFVTGALVAVPEATAWALLGSSMLPVALGEHRARKAIQAVPNPT